MLLPERMATAVEELRPRLTKAWADAADFCKCLAISNATPVTASGITLGKEDLIWRLCGPVFEAICDKARIGIQRVRGANIDEAAGPMIEGGSGREDVDATDGHE